MFYLTTHSTHFIYGYMATKFITIKIKGAVPHHKPGSSVVRTFTHGAMVVGSILHGVNPLSYFSFQPVLHDWSNKGHGMCYPVCGMVHIKYPLLLIGKSSRCGSLDVLETIHCKINSLQWVLV